MLSMGTSNAATNANESAANTETVIATVTIPSVGSSGQSAVLLFGSVTVTPGASVTGATLRWRRTGLTGTLIRSSGNITSPAPLAALSNYAFNAVDTIGAEQTSGTYVLTFQGAGEGAAAAFNSAHLIGIAA